MSTTMTRQDQIQAALQGFVNRTAGVEGASIVSMDGFPLASALPAGSDEDRVAAMGAAALAMGARTASELRRGNLEQVLVKGDSGYVILVQAGPEAVLEAISAAKTNLGMLLLEMKQTAEQVSQQLR